MEGAAKKSQRGGARAKEQGGEGGGDEAAYRRGPCGLWEKKKRAAMPDVTKKPGLLRSVRRSGRPGAASSKLTQKGGVTGGVKEQRAWSRKTEEKHALKA